MYDMCDELPGPRARHVSRVQTMIYVDCCGRDHDAHFSGSTPEQDVASPAAAVLERRPSRTTQEKRKKGERATAISRAHSAAVELS